MFETDFYFFLLKNKKYKQEAIFYYESLLLSLLNRSCTFIGEYSILTTYLRYGKISEDTIHKTFQNDIHPENWYKLEMKSLSILLEKIDGPDKKFLEDGPYIIGFPFSFAVRRCFLKNRTCFLEEYEQLQTGKIDDYYKKYVKKRDLKNLYRASKEK